MDYWFNFWFEETVALISFLLFIFWSLNWCKCDTETNETNFGNLSQGSLQCEKRNTNKLVKFKTYIYKLAVYHSTLHFEGIFASRLPPI